MSTTASNQSAPIAISGFGGEEVEHGWYYFSGTVSGASPGGLTVTIELPSGVHGTCVTYADGTFSVIIQVRTDGSDDGLVTAQTVDANGQASPEVSFNITPTP